MAIDQIRAAAVQLVIDGAVAGNGTGDGQGYPGMIAEVREGKEAWFGTAGVADLRSGVARRAEEQFRVGSITKLFTSAVILQLAGEYKLGLDDTVERHLSGLVEGGEAITIRQLLNHTSGLFTYTLDEDLLGRFHSEKVLEHRYDKFTPQELVRLAMSHPADFRPGEDFGYCNTNFVLAALIIERATGMSYAEAIEYRIARVLKLSDTYAPGDETGFRGPHCRAYTRLMSPEPDAAVHDLTELNPSYGYGVGEVISTVGDLTTFLSALLGGRLLKPAQMEELMALTPVPDGKWLDGYSYGLGISAVTLANGVTVYGHGGFINGNWSYLYGTRDGGTIVAQHLNADWGQPFGLFTELMEAAFAPGE
ncbi:serine hydrolase domain-containing protein [Kitasatospora sp. NPDC001683]